MDLLKAPDVPPQLAARYAGEASRFWDLFYRRNETRFFKDRHYFAAEFPQLLTAGSVLEVGCGVGNSLFPLLELNPGATLYACDFAPSAVDLVKAHQLYRQHGGRGGRVTAFVADITADDLTASVPAASIDVATMIFVLSAVAPEAMPRALRAVAATLRPGGQLLFRDYAAGDLAQGRLAGQGRQQRLADGCYVRWDGTLAYYFSQAGLRCLLEEAGFRVDSLRHVGKLFENRKTGERMDRRFLQAACTYLGTGGQSGRCGSGSSGGGSHGALVLALGQQQLQTEQHCGEQRVQQAEKQQAQHEQQTQHEHQQQAEQQQRLEEEAVEEDEEGLQAVQLQLAGASLRLLCRPCTSAAAAADRAAAEALASAVQRCPEVFINKIVLELCCWDAPLAALAALRCCRLAVAAGAGPGALQRLRHNAWRNAPLFLFERLCLAQLAWRREEHQQGQEEGECHGDGAAQQAEQLRQSLLLEQLRLVRRAVPGGFDAILAAVPAAASSGDVRQLLGTAAALLLQQPSATVLLACAAGEAGKAAALEAAAGVQLGAAPLPVQLSPAAPAAPLQLLCLRHLS
ncbi:hypothetical protein ABPG75_004017 [Micractinium tetrahymenae]